MPIGSGLSAQFGYGVETTWGTAVTVDHFAPFNSETVTQTKNVIQSQGLRAGGGFDRAAGRGVSRRAVGGDVAMDFSTRKMGLLLKHMLGSTVVTPTQIATTTAYRQVHQWGTNQGYGLTVQIGTPQTDGTVVPFTYNGMKVAQWDFSISDNALATLTLTFAGQAETTATALVAYSPVAGAASWSFAQAAALKIGGTASTASGTVSIASGVQMTSLVTGFTLRGTRGMADARYGLGNSGLRGQPIENAYWQVTGSLATEFASRAELYDLFVSDAGTALQLTLGGDAAHASQIGTSGNYDTLDIVLPVVKFDDAAANVGGPDIVGQTANFSVLDDQANAPVQFTVVSADTTL